MTRQVAFFFDADRCKLPHLRRREEGRRRMSRQAAFFPDCDADRRTGETAAAKGDAT